MSSYVPTTSQEVRTCEISKVLMLRKLRPIVIDHRCFEAWLGFLFHYSLQFISKKKALTFSDWLLMPAFTLKEVS